MSNEPLLLHQDTRGQYFSSTLTEGEPVSDIKRQSELGHIII